jgi:PUA-domain protein
MLHLEECSIMPRTFRRHFLKEKQATQLLLKFSQQLKKNPKQLFGTKTHVESIETQVGQIFLIDGKPQLASYEETLLPTLLSEEILNHLPKIVVNMGAVPHICNGADLMAPGVIQIEGRFQADEFLLIIDERHHKPLAIGKALFNSENTENLKRGRIAKNLHHVGDRLWKLLQQL